MVSRAEWSDAAATPRRARPVRPRLRHPGAQPTRSGRRGTARRTGRVHRDLRIGEVVAGFRHHLRRGAAALLRVRRPVCPQAAAADRRAEGRRHHRASARRRAAAAARDGVVAVVRRHGDDAVEPVADAVLPRRHVPAGLHRAIGLRRVLPEHRRRRMPRVPRPRQDPPGHRGHARSRPVVDHPRGRRRRMAGSLAGAEPARHPHHARLRHRQAVAQAVEEATRLDPVHRRAADRRDPPGPAQRDGRLLLQRHVLQCRAPRPAHARELAERDDAQAGAEVRRQRGLPGVPRLRTAARGAAP